jgi:flavin reductase (DIM6/NTAB) family NADH-FMN oxidoreductase RutF
MPMDTQFFKHGMRRLAAGVCLITTEDEDGMRSGMTATAVCSVSAEPPTLLCCINRNNNSYAMIRRTGVFAVNVLALDDRPLADQFARPLSSGAKFSLGLWRQLETRAPILESALAGFDCKLGQAVEVGTHGIIFGQIQAVHTRAVAAKPLLYAHGSYGGFASSAAASDLDSLWIPTWTHEPH